MSAHLILVLVAYWLDVSALVDINTIQQLKDVNLLYAHLIQVYNLAGNASVIQDFILMVVNVKKYQLARQDQVGHHPLFVNAIHPLNIWLIMSVNLVDLTQHGTGLNVDVYQDSF